MGYNKRFSLWINKLYAKRDIWHFQIIQECKRSLLVTRFINKISKTKHFIDKSYFNSSLRTTNTKWMWMAVEWHTFAMHSPSALVTYISYSEYVCYRMKDSFAIACMLPLRCSSFTPSKQNISIRYFLYILACISLWLSYIISLRICAYS